jgi:hypothetical protein
MPPTGGEKRSGIFADFLFYVIKSVLYLLAVRLGFAAFGRRQVRRPEKKVRLDAESREQYCTIRLRQS